MVGIEGSRKLVWAGFCSLSIRVPPEICFRPSDEREFRCKSLSAFFTATLQFDDHPGNSLLGCHSYGFQVNRCRHLLSVRTAKFALEESCIYTYKYWETVSMSLLYHKANMARAISDLTSLSRPDKYHSNRIQAHHLQVKGISLSQGTMLNQYTSPHSPGRFWKAFRERHPLGKKPPSVCTEVHTIAIPHP